MKIPEYSNVSTLDTSDLFIVETKNGTKNIKTSDLKESVGGIDGELDETQMKTLTDIL